MSQSCVTFATSCKGKGEHECIASEVTMHAFEARNVWSFIISLLLLNLVVSPLCMLDGEARIVIWDGASFHN